ncbi:hypothetical protein LEN26_004349 [Aphanomyces euteiches]|nr:hypothetical protein LEN26_004349 [Aphanomyces euteiches]
MLFSTEIVLHVAFFIEEWDTLLDYIEALRPANVLGPLEHLKQLQSLQWQSVDLWPKLDLRRMNDASRTELEAIVQHYPQVIVDYKMDLAWICRFVDPSTRIYLTTGIKYPREYFDMHELSRWKPFRVPSVDKVNVNPNKIEKTLSFLDNLESFQWWLCTRPIARCIFEFAAQSSSLVRLNLGTDRPKDPRHCKITSSMALALVEWIDSKPIRSFEMVYFTWENQYLRQGVVTTALSKSTLETFRLHEVSALTSRFSGEYKRGRKSIHFYLDVGSFDSDLAIGFLKLFWPLMQPEKIETMIAEGCDLEIFDSVWGILEPFLRLAKVKSVDLR